MIELKNLTKIYRTGGIETPALRGIDLQIAKGEFTAITGKSGCGKTTLLNLLGGMDAPTSGLYRMEGREISSLRGRALAAFRNKTIGFIFQSFHLISELSVVDNVSLPLGYAGVRASERKEKSIELLQKVGLKDHLHKGPNELSGGQRQRVAIARALINQPALLLADEPTGNLDEKTGQEILQLIQSVHQEGTTVILVTHDPQIASACGRIIHMSDGRIERGISHRDWIGETF